MRSQKTNMVTIRTPEGIEFSMMLAGPVTRFLAWSIDVACIAVMIMIMNILLGIIGIISRDLATAVSFIGYFIVSIGYGIVMEWYWQGQTLGKRILRLRVTDVQGLRLQFNQIVIRNLLRFVDSLPTFYLLGGLTCLMNRRYQRLGDFAANTIVTRHPNILEPDLDQLLNGKYNSFRKYPHLEARLRQRVSPQEAQIALQSLIRRDELDPQARIDLFDAMASHFAAIVNFPREATDGISAEQYVRNVADALFRPKTTGQGIKNHSGAI